MDMINGLVIIWSAAIIAHNLLIFAIACVLSQFNYKLFTCVNFLLMKPDEVLVDNRYGSIFLYLQRYNSFVAFSFVLLFFNFFRYLNAIQTNAPHLLRYLATAFIVNKRKRNQFKEFIKVIQQEQHSFKDPITEFLACVYVNYDFDGAQKKMKECEEVSPLGQSGWFD